MSLNPTQALLAIEMAIEANIPLLLWGDSGIGKSSMVKEALGRVKMRIADKQSFLYHQPFDSQFPSQVDSGNFNVSVDDLRLAHCDIADFGIPRIFAEVMQNNKKTLIPYEQAKPESIIDFVHQTTRPSWWKHESEPGLNVLFLDEVNRGDRTAQNGAMSILAERELRGRIGCKGLRLVGAANPNANNMQTEELGTAMKARWCHVEVTTSTTSYLANRFDYLDPISAQIIMDQKNALVKKSSENIADEWSVEDQIEWRPRTWEMHAQLAKYMLWNHNFDSTWLEPRKYALQEMMAGLIGRAYSVIFWKSFESGDYLNVEKLLNGNQTYAKLAKIGPDRPAYMVQIIRNTMTDDSFRDANGKATPKRMQAFLSFFLSLINERQELAASLAIFLNSKAGLNSYAQMNKILQANTEYQGFARSISSSLNKV